MKGAKEKRSERRKESKRNTERINAKKSHLEEEGRKVEEVRHEVRDKGQGYLGGDSEERHAHYGGLGKAVEILLFYFNSYVFSIYQKNIDFSVDSSYSVSSLFVKKLI